MRLRHFVPAVLFLAVLVVGMGHFAATTTPITTASSLLEIRPDEPASLEPANVLQQAGLYFEENRGQAGDHAGFLSRTPTYSLFLTPTTAQLNLYRASQAPAQLKMRLVGANAEASGHGEQPTLGHSHYLRGNNPAAWQTEVPHVGSVRYEAVYPGIDLVYYGNPHHLEYDFVVAPGTDPQVITMDFDGAAQQHIDEQGNLVLSFADGDVQFKAPVTYQEIDGERHAVESAFAVHRDETVGFELGSYDPTQPLIIDPEVVYATYLGGVGQDEAYGVAADDNGHVYITGSTSSADLPTFNAIQAERLGSDDVFIAKVNAETGDVVYITYLGGTDVQDEDANSIAVDATGSAYVTGITASADFPVLNAFQPNRRGTLDAFVTKLNPDGTLAYSTFLGGSGNIFDSGTLSEGHDIAVTPGGEAYVTGNTGAVDFPVVNAFQNNIVDRGDAFLTKFNAQGGVVFSTYLGGNGNDEGLGVDVDAAGNAVVVGYVRSPDFPVLNAQQPTLSGDVDGFISRFSPEGGLLYSTYWGGTGLDYLHDVAFAPSGNFFVGGSTNSADYPVTNAFQPSLNGTTDAVIAQFSNDGLTTLNSSYYGGSSSEAHSNSLERRVYVATDNNGNAYLNSYTLSDDLPVVNALQPTLSGLFDAFVIKVMADGNLAYASYVGGSVNDFEGGVAVNADGVVFVGGRTTSPDVPTVNAFQDTYVLNFDAFIYAFTIDADLELPIEGVAYAPEHPDPNIGPFQSTFRNLSVEGPGLENVNAVVFDPPGDLFPQNIRASANEVLFDLVVVHGAALGERDLILRTSDNQEIRVTDLINKKFVVTRIITAFNQVVDAEELSNEENANRLIAHKKGVMRIEFDDPLQYGVRYAGLLQVDNLAERPVSPFYHTPESGYSENTVLDGRDHLLIPFPMQGPGEMGLPPGDHNFRCFLVSDDRVMLCPEITRRFVLSDPIDIVAVRVAVPGTHPAQFLPSRAEAEAAIDGLKLVYPVSETQVAFTVTSPTGNADDTVPLPGNITNRQSPLASGGSIAHTTRPGRRALFAYLGQLLNAINRDTGAQHQMLIGFLPNDFLSIDENADGVLDGADSYVAGVAREDICVAMISTAADDLKQTFAHEVGHIIRSCTNALERTNFGDEYEGGVFYCETNPPVGGLEDWDDMDCPNSQLINGVHGNTEGTYPSLSALHPVTLRPLINYQGVSRSATYFNFMAGGKNDAELSVSTLAYNALMDVLVSDIGLKSEQQNLLQIPMHLTKNGDVRFNPFSMIQRPGPSRSGGGAYTVELRDRGGAVLATHSFDPDFVEVSEPPQPVDEIDLAVNLAMPAGTREVMVMRDGTPVATQEITDNAPAVDITAPGAGQSVSGPITLRWNATDADGDALTYRVGLSINGGRSFLLASDLASASYTYDASSLSIGTSVTFMVVANDGFNEGRDLVSATIAPAQGASLVLNWDPPPAGEGLVAPANLTVALAEALPKRSPTVLDAPRRRVGAGKVTRPTGPAQDTIDEVEPNNFPEEAQLLMGETPLAVQGQLEVDDVGGLLLNFNDGSQDDLEDLFQITLTEPGLTLELTGLTSDSDMYLLDEEASAILNASNFIGADVDELIDDPELEAGTYFIAVSIYDPAPGGGNVTPYVLTVTGMLEGGDGEPPVLEGYNIYRSAQPNARATGSLLVSVEPTTTTYTDFVPTNGRVYYQVTAVYDQGESAPSGETTLDIRTEVETETVPDGFVLAQNYPNPFTPPTTIAYTLPAGWGHAPVSITVYDMLGRRVRVLTQGRQPTGSHTVTWDGRDAAGRLLPSGVYVYRLETSTFSLTRKMVLLHQ